MPRSAIRSLILLESLAIGCAPPPSLPAPHHDACAVKAELARARQQALSTGHLLRALDVAGAFDAACPKESETIARISLDASISLGDASLARRRGAPPETLFKPDGAATAFPSPVEASAGYARALAAYQAGQWAEARTTALSVGASEGPMATEGFILAARCAEREGNAARAARMWARAYRAGCTGQTACAVQAPREDLFTRAALFGQYTPWHSGDLCAHSIQYISGILHGTWHLSAGAGDFDVREIPSRVLLERIEPPKGAVAVCFSRDGEWRVAFTYDHGDASLRVGRRDGIWKAFSPPRALSPGPVLHVGADGRLVIPEHQIGPDREAFKFTSFDPATPVFRAERWQIGDTTGALDRDGLFYSALHVNRTTRGEDGGVALGRYRFTVPKGEFVYGAGDDVDVGPVDDQGRLFAMLGGKVAWLDGRSGKLLASVDRPHVSVSRTHERVGVVLPSTMVWQDGDSVLHSVNLQTGAATHGGVVWHPPSDSAEAVRRVIAALPTGASTQTWATFDGWRISKIEGDVVGVEAADRSVIHVVVAADQKAAMVMNDRGGFEFVGRASPVFRASASCGGDWARRTPTPTGHVWPLEVCGAAMEEPGFTASWIGRAHAAMQSSEGRGAPAQVTPGKRL